ncbi:MAG: hypothetical protein K0U47_12000 [Epsilonproteobacteria bacterium]|nr:hypothetical protein [Campylobacterota bacterium]
MLFPKVLLLLFSLSFLFCTESNKQLTTPQETLALLKEIKSEAIVLGSGEKEIYSFIDPYCSMSKMYLKQLYKNKKRMFKKYKVYLYLYELKRKNSAQMIKNIYSADNSLLMLKEVMVNGESVELEEVDDIQIDEKMAKIETFSKKIGVFKRPFIISNGKAK